MELFYFSIALKIKTSPDAVIFTESAHPDKG
jgi:hypothetical protein